MSAIEIDVGGTRSAVRHLTAASQSVCFAGGLVAHAAGTGALVDEHLDVAHLLAEIGDETELVGRVLSLTADRAEASDTMLAGMFGAASRATLERLIVSINDRTGASVRSLLDAFDVAAATDLPPAIAGLSPAAARAWFGSLSTSDRLVLVGRHSDPLSTTSVAPVSREWTRRLDADDLRQLYRIRALDRAGIDLDRWQPWLGIDANRDTVERVYEYYADLYRMDTGRFWWAGMAAMIGPSFYAGFADLDAFAELLDTAAVVAQGPLGALVPGGGAIGHVTELTGLTSELGWYQRQLLLMQREIFLDMAPAHEAYLDGGTEGVERLYADDTYDFRAPTIAAWRAIDAGWRAGDQTMVAVGTAALLRREQEYVIGDDYDLMRARPITGLAVTNVMTAVGAPSVPGARAFAEVFPARIATNRYVGTPRTLPAPPGFGWLPDVALPHLGADGTAFVETPLPDGNISVFADRWRLIEADTLPVFEELAAHHPDVVLDQLARPVGERAVDYAISERLRGLVRDAVTDWHAGIDVDLEVGW